MTHFQQKSQRQQHSERDLQTPVSATPSTHTSSTTSTLANNGMKAIKTEKLLLHHYCKNWLLTYHYCNE